MIAEIDHKLCAWGRWAMKAAKSGIGYPSVSPMFRDMPRSNVFRSCEPIGAFTNADMELISQAVVQLPEIHRITVIVHYQHAKNWNESSRKLGISRKTLSQYLHQAQSRIANVLADGCLQSKPDAVRFVKLP